MGTPVMAAKMTFSGRLGLSEVKPRLGTRGFM